MTLDDRTVLEAARSDPSGFIRGLDRGVLEEVQREPDLLPAIKMSVDEDYRPGRFLLTGSANVLSRYRNHEAKRELSFVQIESTRQNTPDVSFSIETIAPRPDVSVGFDRILPTDDASCRPSRASRARS